jgi:uncharacterized phiE125 gp8 family phage protein
MTLVLITPPTQDVVTLAEAKAHLRVDASDDDVLIGGLIKAATSVLDPAGGGWLGRALRPQTWEARLRAFPDCYFLLPYPPAIEVVSIKYDDPYGVEQTVDSATYRLLGLSSVQPARLDPAFGASWPSVRHGDEAVRIRFRAGYPAAEGEASDLLPAAIKAAVLLMVGDLYENRETVAVGATTAKIETSATVDALLAPYRVFL